MTVSAGNIALASDYEELRLRVNAWFYDADPLCSFGSIYQQFGWGGDATPQVLTGDKILASQMNELIDRINIGALMTGATPTQTRISAGNSVLASQYNTADAKDVLITALKNNINPGFTSYLDATNDARTTQYNSTIDCAFRYTFSSFNEARYFFNSGGKLLFSGACTGYTTAWGYDGQGIDNILTQMGSITMNYTITTQSGSGGTTSSIGYYDLTTSYQQIFQQQGVGAYSSSYVTLQARRSATGNYVDIRFIVTPQGIVNGTTTAYTGYSKLYDQPSIPVPGSTVDLHINPPSSVTVFETFE
jgi:hypothetical protein